MAGFFWVRWGDFAGSTVMSSMHLKNSGRCVENGSEGRSGLWWTNCGIHERLRHPRKGCFQGPGTWQWKSEGLDVRIWERIRKSKEPLGYAYPKFLKSFLNQKITSSFKWIYEVQISGCKDHKILKRKMWNMSKIYCNWKTVGHPEMLKERSPPGA